MTRARELADSADKDFAGTVTVDGIVVDTDLQFATGATVTTILDEDNMGSDSATALSTQQAIKAYVDTQAVTVVVNDTTPQLGGNLDVNGNAITGSTVSINGSTGEFMITATENGPVALRYDNNLKLTTKSDGVDITGELQADSLDIDGDGDITGNLTLGGNLNLGDDDKAIFGAGSDLQIYHDTSSVDSKIVDTGSGNLRIMADNLRLQTAAGTANYATADNGGAFSLYHNGSAKLATTVSGCDITGILTADDVYVATSLRHEGDTDTYLYFPSAGDNIGLVTNGSEAMRIDSSGNLLAGTTSSPATLIATSSTEGFAYGNGLYQVTSRSGGVTAYFNRLTSDGSLVEFRKDGTTVGSITATSGDLAIDGGSSHTGLRFVSSYIQPRLNSSVSNGGIDLGGSAARFKDLWLGGGVYLGGTASTNKLDDYEEGTWTPTYGGSTSNPTVTHDTQEGRYTKVGNLVTIAFKIGTDVATGGSGNLLVNGLPFTPLTSAYFTVVAYNFTGANSTYNSDRPIYGFVTGSTIRVWRADTGNLQCSALYNGANCNRLFAVFHYYTSA